MERKVDLFYFLTVLFLMCFGLLMVYSISSVYAEKLFKDPSFFTKRHIFLLSLSFAFLIICSFIPLNLVRKLTIPALLLSLLALILVFIPPLGSEVKGASRWLNLGFIRIQPSEFAKVTIVMYLADYIKRKKHLIENFKEGFLPPILIIAVISFLIFAEPDFGNGAFIFLLGIITLLAGGAKFSHTLLIFLLLFLPSSILLIISEQYRLKRIISFMNPWKFSQSMGFQTVQSYLALGSGGLLGIGLGNSNQKLFYLPEAHTDFVLSIIGEELGFIGLEAVFLAVTYLCLKGYMISLKEEDLYRKVLAAGLTSVIFLQYLINASVVMGLLPPKGMPFPFISYGGSFLLTCAVACGLILNIGSEHE